MLTQILKILENVPDQFKDRTVAVIGHKEAIVPFQRTKGLDNRINVFKANNFGPDFTGRWTEEKNLQWIKNVAEDKQVVYFASQELKPLKEGKVSWTRE